MSYEPKINDYVKWHREYYSVEGWVYFVDEEYITIEIGIKPKPICQYTKNERHKNIHTLVLCYPQNWKDLEYIKSR